MTTNPYEQLSAEDLDQEIRAAGARIDAASHTHRALLRERRRRNLESPISETGEARG